MRIYSDDSFAKVYEKSLRELLYSPEFVSKPRELKINESLNVTLEIKNPLLSTYGNIRRGSQDKYIAAELLWYFAGRNDVAYIKKYAKFWESIQNNDGTVNSAYGNLIFTERNDHMYNQYGWALDSLSKDKDSRQAILHFNKPAHQWSRNKDFVCTMYGIFHIRNNRLDFTVTMRSNDAILGTPTDVAFFTCLQQQMLSHLQVLKYPDLELGKYTHIVNSYHLYDKHFKLVEEMLLEDFKSIGFPKLEADLVLPSGAPSNLLVNFIENDSDLNNVSTKDPLFNWIKNNIV